MPRIRLGPPADFAGPGPWRVRRWARPFEIRREEGGGLVAVELVCRHQNADLSGVAARDGELTCPRHGWRYDAATGECFDRPGQALRRFSVSATAGVLWIGDRDNS